MSKFKLYARIVAAVACALVLIAIDFAKLSLSGVVISSVGTAMILFLLVPPLLAQAKKG